MTKIFDIVPGWLYALAIAALLALAGVQQVRIADAHAETAKVAKEFADAKALAADEARKAEQAAREEEQRREERKQEIIDEAQRQTELAQAAAAGASSALDELQHKYSALAAAIRGTPSDSRAPKPSEAAEDPIGMLAVVLGRLGERAKVVERFADDAHIAGAACESYADGLQPPNR